MKVDAWLSMVVYTAGTLGFYVLGAAILNRQGLTVGDDGAITAYRNGAAYGKSYTSSGLKRFKAGEWQVSLGVRHTPAANGKLLAGAVDRAALEATAIGPQMLDGMAAICAVWPRGPVDPDFAEPLDSDVPALLLSGEFDPATPASYGEMAVRGFANGRHVVVPGQGHGVTRLPCVQGLLRQFVEAGSAAALDAACVARIVPAPFFLSFNGNAP